MAFILPVILLLVFGITEFGRAWMTLNVMHTATREGARLAAVLPPGFDPADVQTRVEEVLDTGRVPWTNIGVTGPDADDRITVTVDADFVVIPGQIMQTFNGTIPLSASTTMRYEY